MTTGVGAQKLKMYSVNNSMGNLLIGKKTYKQVAEILEMLSWRIPTIGKRFKPGIYW